MHHYLVISKLKPIYIDKSLKYWEGRGEEREDKALKKGFIKLIQGYFTLKKYIGSKFSNAFLFVIF